MIVSEFRNHLQSILEQYEPGRHVASAAPEPDPALFLLPEESQSANLRLRSLAYLLHSAYGFGALLEIKVKRLVEQCSLFIDAYGDGPAGVLRTPARINLLGEHIDYVSYLSTYSLTLGSREHDMILFFRPAKNGRVRGRSTLEHCEPFVFDLAEGPSSGSGRDWESFLYNNPAPEPHWGNYIKGAVFYARMHHRDKVCHGFDFVVDSTIPPAGGASSSSTLTVLAGAAVRRSNQVPYDASELARDSARAEWYVETRDGSMDHITICMARRMHAVHISYSDEETEAVPMTLPQVRWVTFYTRPANKGKEVMLEYNERAAVSRIIIPALIETWGTTDSEGYVAWNAAVESARAGSLAALDEIEQWLQLLPETITPADLEKNHPEAFGECKLAFPILVQERRHDPIKVRSRALHHVGEVRRVTAAARELRAVTLRSGADRQSATSVLRCLGALLSQSHASLRDRYEVSTPDVERLIDFVTADTRVYGARLMGGGFGGNVLALTTAEHAGDVVARMQSLFYEPEHRHAVAEGSVMVSTPGDGLSALDFETATRATVEFFNSAWRDSERFREPIRRMLDQLIIDPAATETWPVIVAAGRGRRARESGIPVPKPLVPVAGTPALKRVLDAIQSMELRMRPPVIIVSPETERPVRDLLQGYDVIYATQPHALGTGDAVLCAHELMKDFRGRTLVIWGTQPVIRAETVRGTIRLAAIFPDYDMVVPTAVTSDPYAPLLRDECGNVRASRETHLEHAECSRYGETNIGLFVVSNVVLFRVLSELRQAFWLENERRYDRPGGELGFPNELITHLCGRRGGVLASPIADFREEKGIKSQADIAVCERYIRELAMAD